jgi:hypothetical protein
VLKEKYEPSYHRGIEILGGHRGAEMVTRQEGNMRNDGRVLGGVAGGGIGFDKPDVGVFNGAIQQLSGKLRVCSTTSRPRREPEGRLSVILCYKCGFTGHISKELYCFS